MSETTVQPEVADEHDEHEHPSDVQYITIGAILALITGAEVMTYFVDIGGALVPALFVMMIVKFALVAAWFMHLKFDIELFWRLFVTGIVLATIVYLAMLTTFEFLDEFNF